MSITVAETPEQREYARFLAEIEARKRHVAELRSELEGLRLALARFQAVYHARVGPLFVDLDRARLAIEEYEQRVARLRSDPAGNPQEVEEELTRAFADRRQTIDEQEAENRRFEEDAARQPEQPDAVTAGELQRLYRDLARRFHPDLARTEAERMRKEPLMRRVNSAFRERDIARLRALGQELEVEDPAFEARTLGDKLAWAVKEVARLDGLARELEAALARTRANDTHRMWQRHEAGEPVLDLLQEDLARELAEARDRLADLIAVYRQLVEARVP